MIPKFRVWDVHNKKMLTESELVIWNGNVYANDYQKIFKMFMEGARGLVGYSVDDKYLMQSTGLFDKNGKEIFEGDVVRMASGELLPIKLHHGMFIPVCFYVSSVFELVGNVFEHPELLEDPDFRKDEQ